MTFDYLIVGAGSAGCVLANRLSANPQHRVCLLEAGPPDDSLLVRVPAGIIALMRSRRRNWRYWSVPQTALDGRQLYIPRGKTLGGSSAVNAMIYTRGHRTDYDHWAALGNPGWAYEDVLPIFKRSENHARGADAFHGADGSLAVSDLRYTHPVTAAFTAAAVQAGYRENHDFSGAEQEGAGPYQLTQRDGERCSIARAYLAPVRERSNLSVLTGALVTRVLLDGTRATGVECQLRGGVRRIEAGTVILAAGAINSPQLLLLSGIGAREKLAPHGIRQQHALPGVGENLQDHPDALIVHRSRRHDSLSLGPGYLPQALRNAIRWGRARQGAFTTNVAEGGGFIRSQASEAIPDLQLHISAALLDNHGLNWRFSLGWGYSAHVAVLRPRSRGTVTLASADPAAAPRIDPALLSDPDDAERLLRGVKILREILAQDALAPWRGAEILPGAAVTSDAGLRQFLRAKTETIYHPVGTCKMGRDDMAVVDPNLRVHGLDGLYVIDASIMPTLIGGNTNAPTVMIAEKAADGLLAPQ
ncbi:MAG TPA: choline dehydrogenase [Rhodanobacteraceae bacterium]|nr:choline dehydrogenase [Rhodanobacteraceae bacterium]